MLSIMFQQVMTILIGYMLCELYKSNHNHEVARLIFYNFTLSKVLDKFKEIRMVLSIHEYASIRML